MNRIISWYAFAGVLALSALVVLFVSTACQVTVNPGGGGDADVEFTVFGKTFRIDLGEAGIFEVTEGADPVQKAVSVQLFEETTTDNPADVEFIVEAAAVTVLDAKALPLRPGATAASFQDGDVVRVRAYVAFGVPDEPCTGTPNLEFELRRINGQTVMYVGGQPVDARAVFRQGARFAGLIRNGVFSLCLEVSSDNATSRVLISGLEVRFLSQDELSNSNANDNSAGPDNANANVNANDNAGDGNANLNDNGSIGNENTNDNAAENANDNTAEGGAFSITGASYPTTVVSDGDVGDMTVSWSGDPVFPVEIVYQPVPGTCPPNVSCTTVRSTFGTEQTSLLCPDFVGCWNLSGTTYFEYEIVMIDDRGVKSAPYSAPFTCQGD